MMNKLKYYTIKLIDVVHEKVLRHHPRQTCNWIGAHKWWDLKTKAENPNELAKWKLEHKYKKQRATNGIADCDAWNLDTHLAHILIIGLKQLYRDGSPIGHPVYLCPECEVGNKHDDPCIGYEKWKLILLEMIEGFEAYKEADYLSKNSGFAYRKVNRALELLKENFTALWD